MTEPMETEDESYYDNPPDKITSTYSKPIVKKSTGNMKPTVKKTPDKGMVVGSMVEVEPRKGLKLRGVIKWVGVDERIGEDVFLAGIELDDDIPGFDYKICTDGTYLSRHYFESKQRAFFTKLNTCKPDSRFIENLQQTQSNRLALGYKDDTETLESIEGCILPNVDRDVYLGRDKGIQGYHNSCYMDSTLFAMFSYSSAFDIALHRTKRNADTLEYDVVQRILRRKIVNPLREKGYVKHESVLELRKCLDNSQLGDIGGFTTAEKDPEEFFVLLFVKVLNVDSFIKLKMIGSDNEEVSHLYQIFAEKDERHILPSIQYLVEYSFLTADIQLAEVPSVMILQMPRFGQQKLYDRIQIKSKLDISHLMSYLRHQCIVCGENADGYCKECCCVLSLDTVYTYLCEKCYGYFHKHPQRKHHKKSEFKKYDKRISKQNKSHDLSCHEPIILELFAVVCIEKSHYVSFVKSGYDEEASWLFFDSMADRLGEENGQNIPEVSNVNEVKDLLNTDAFTISRLHKKEDEKVLRLFQDASLCFYRHKDLSIYR